MVTRSEQLQIRVTPEEKAALRRAARRAGQDLSGYVLSRALPREEERLRAILAALSRNEGPARFALAELNDFLTELAPTRFGGALEQVDLHELSPFERNYVAAMVEQAAARKGVKPPEWTRRVLPLEEPHFATPMKSLRPHLLGAAPVPFKRRNIFIDSSVGDRV
jgi:hypothetical protein